MLATWPDIVKACGLVPGQTHQAASVVIADTISADGRLAVVDFPVLSRNSRIKQDWISRVCLSDGKTWAITLQVYQTLLQKRLGRSLWCSFFRETEKRCNSVGEPMGVRRLFTIGADYL